MDSEFGGGGEIADGDFTMKTKSDGGRVEVATRVAESCPVDTLIK